MSKKGELYRGLIDDLGAAESALAEAQRDAKRYRWLRERIWYKPARYDGFAKGRWVCDLWLVTEQGEDADTAIDQAMEHQEGGT